MNKFAADTINYLDWELEIEFEIALTDGGKLNFDTSLPHFNMRKKLYVNVTLHLTVNIEY